MSEEAQAVAQDPAAQEAVQVQAPAEATQGQGPWSDSLATSFEDELIRNQVDAYLRENVQPYVTQLEQRSKVSPEAEAGEKLLRQLNEDPSSMYLALTQELWGDEAVDTVAESLRTLLSEEPEPTTPAEPEEGKIAFENLPPEVQEAVQERQQNQAKTAYENALSEIETDNPDLFFDRDLFNPFVVAAEGDLDVALQGYKSAVDRYGIKAPEPETTEVEDTEETNGAPPAIGSDTAAPTAPPVQKNYSSFDEAIDDMLLDFKPSAPPVVGGV